MLCIVVSFNLSMTWHIKRDYDKPNIPTIFWIIHLIYDLTYQKGLRLDCLSSFKNSATTYLWPDISKGITTLIVVDEWCLEFAYLWPDISKGITTQFKVTGSMTDVFLSMTWHIKRDYDLINFFFFLTKLFLSMTWHIKRDYDTMNLATRPLGTISLSMTWHIKRDYDNQGALSYLPPSCLSMTWHIKRDYDQVQTL